VQGGSIYKSVNLSLHCHYQTNIMIRGICFLAISLLFVCSSAEDADNSVCSITPQPLPYKLSVCTMVYNEARYIEEWLAYHLLLKVDHFYIYNDRSTDNLLQVLAPYINKGLVSLIPWGLKNRTIDPKFVPEDPIFTRPQRFAIGDCLFNRKSESEWFAIFDIDEFLVLNKFFPDLHAFLPYAAMNADDYLIPMTVFGTAGHTKTPNGLVIKDYQIRANLTIFGINPYDGKFSGKSMYKSGCGLPNVHFTNSLRPGCRKYQGWVSAENSGAHLPLIINHYPVKSWDHFKDKMEKWNFGLSEEDFYKFVAFSNKIWDNTTVGYVEPVEKLVKCMREYKL